MRLEFIIIACVGMLDLTLASLFNRLFLFASGAAVVVIVLMSDGMGLAVLLTSVRLVVVEAA